MTEQEVLKVIQKAFAGLLHSGAYRFANDGAVLPTTPEKKLVLSTDGFASEMDCRDNWGTASQAGARAIKQNLSDLAAMGATPVGFKWSLSLSRDWINNPLGFQAFLQGAAKVCDENRLLLLGGDLGWQKKAFNATLQL
jgi:thiamine-monophosphate kinase